MGAQVRAFMPSQGYENCGNATLVAARGVPSPLRAGASSASMPSLDLAAATFLELKFAAFGKCATLHTAPCKHLHDYEPQVCSVLGTAQHSTCTLQHFSVPRTSCLLRVGSARPYISYRELWYTQ